ncbi:unnamed protein product [Blepharisma stoltei]|uniref:Uncharacterized protein n=1 Tax=Blepharisma stoltei TaxID=1481888 RepID=A0AAU9JIJ8_9CILI|nr:unnamed protein product [Blepharisma stoltei]
MSMLLKRRGLHHEFSAVFSNTLSNPVDILNSPMIKSPMSTPARISYAELSEEFHNSGVSYMRQLLLRKTASSYYSDFGMDYESTYILLNSIADILLLNEIEILYWSYLLQRTLRHNLSLPPQNICNLTAYLSKISFNEDIEPFEKIMGGTQFKLHFNNWLLITDFSTEPNLREINKMFSQLVYNIKMEDGDKDYEEMVDNLMHTPKRKESMGSELRSEISSIGDLDAELIIFQKDFMCGEKLSPIDDDVK